MEDQGLVGKLALARDCRSKGVMLFGRLRSAGLGLAESGEEEWYRPARGDAVLPMTSALAAEGDAVSARSQNGGSRTARASVVRQSRRAI